MSARKQRDVNSSHRRKKPSRSIKKSILIVCEGKTEFTYFSRLGTLLGTATVDVIPYKGKNSHAIGVLEDAIKKEELLKKEGNPLNLTEGDAVWCVFDRGDTGNNSETAYQEAKRLADEKHYKLAISNPCFEVWFMCHFTDSTRPYETAAAVEKALKEEKYIPNYKKGGCHYDLLSTKKDTAIKNAQKLIKFHNDNGKKPFDKEANPVTTVDKLIMFLDSLAS